MNVNLLQILSIIAIFQAILMAVFFLLNKKSNRSSSLILSSMLFVFSLLCIYSLLISFDEVKRDPAYQKYIFLLGNMSFFVGPLLFFYIKSLLNDSFSFKAKYWFHFLPFIIATIISILLLKDYEEFYLWLYPGRIYFSGVVILQNFLYAINSLRLLNQNGLNFRSFLSYISGLKLAWVRFFISGFIVLWLIQFQLFIGWDVLEQPRWCPYSVSLYILTAFFFFNAMIYLGLKKPEMFNQGQKYQHSVLKKTDKEKYLGELMLLVEHERIYLRPSISLTELAQRLKIAPCYVSQIINETFQQNFRDFINKYRIEESKKMLLQKDLNLNILGIALDAGFNSKSAFNNAFKKYMGITPKEFKKKTACSDCLN